MKINLLIADDEELIRKGLIARLSYLGFEFGEILEQKPALRHWRQSGCMIYPLPSRISGCLIWTGLPSSGRPRSSPSSAFHGVKRLCRI